MRIRLTNDQQTLQNLDLAVERDKVVGQSDDQVARYLRYLGLPDHIVQDGDPTNLLPLRAPFDGLVIHRDMVVGEVVNSTPHQFVVADTSTLWLVLHLRPEDVGKVAPPSDQEVVFRPQGGKDDVAVGKLTWISAEVDDKTRTVRARAIVANPYGRLRPNTFGSAGIAIRQVPRAVAVPEAAVQRNGNVHLVFIRESDQVFQPREVKLGIRQDGFFEIREGLRAGEVIALEGTHVLKSEMNKDQISSTDD
jgi:cobalt-zinc-cadmium efflux system membrane fusion protein